MAAVNHRVIAAFDVGSNSIKMSVARHAEDTRIEEFSWASDTVRLGLGLDRSGLLAPDRVDAALEVLGGFAREARRAGATRLIGVATEAARVAANGPAFLDRIRAETGIEIVTITGEQEAQLTFQGLAASIDISGRLLVADIGGGSTELIDATDGMVLAVRSVPLGSGRLAEHYIAHDPPDPMELRACREAALRLLAPAALPPGNGLRLVAVGGTGEYLMRLLPTGHGATAADVDDVLDRLTRIEASDLARLLVIPEARARVLPAGVAIVRALIDRAAPAMIEGARSGIRTGLLIAAFAGDI
jgi:exopolyphosphatase/guanosine-5'-triphosphate,3'-diphosphate pyrophosphatase